MKPTNSNFSEAPLRRVCTVAEVRAIEQELFRTEEPYAVMSAAGKQVARYCPASAQSMLLVAGPGNNGGDAYVAATALLAKTRCAHVWAPLGPPVTADAQRALRDFQQAGGKVLDSSPQWRDYDCVVDGLFGIGLGRDLQQDALRAVQEINTAMLPVIAVDTPSGLCADTATLRGAAVHALATVSFFCAKPGLLMGVGKKLAGEVHIAELGATELVRDRGGQVIDQPCGHEVLRRSAAAHKGSHGTLALIGGAAGMTGALALASRAAVAHGAGKVLAVALGEDAPAFDPLAPEVMWRTQVPEAIDACAIGVGAGTADSAKTMLVAMLKRELPLIIDADGLNMLAQHQELLGTLAQRQNDALLTPHPAEAGRLLGTDTATVQADRLSNARELARRAQAVVVLKGAGTVIAGADGAWGIVAAGNPGLAQAGSGDVLTGIIAALRVQHMAAWPAAATGAWLHAKAADLICEARGGPLGLSLSEVCARSSSLLAQQVG